MSPNGPGDPGHDFAVRKPRRADDARRRVHPWRADPAGRPRPRRAARHEHAAPEGPHFNEKEWKEFQDDDIHAGGAVVCLMGGIFTIGLMLYATIALIVGA